MSKYLPLVKPLDTGPLYPAILWVQWIGQKAGAWGAVPFLCLLLVVNPLVVAEDVPSARSLLLTGHYDEAKAAYAKSAQTDAASALGLARCQVATGRREAARATLTSACERFENPSLLYAELAVLALEGGDDQAAHEHAQAALEIDPDCVAARWVEAERLRTSGRIPEAQRAYAWFIGYHNRQARIDDPCEYLWIGKAVAQHARWTRNSNQFRRLVNELYPAALRLEPDFWPAHLEAARLYAEKFNSPEAARELSRGLAINPQAAELHTAKAALAINEFNLAAAQLSVDRALQLDEGLVEAHWVQADCKLADVKPAEALVWLDKARALNPRDERTLGRLLAVYVALDGRAAGKWSERAQLLQQEVDARNSHCGDFYAAAADSCDRMRRFTLSAEFYRTAYERLPQLMDVRGKLGLVLMRLGEETAASKLLAESFAIDPYNVRVKNMLEVLDVLQGYAVLETPHFVIKFDRGNDDLLASYAARHLEDEIFPEVTKTLGFEPPGKTLIEIFSRHGQTSGHSWFSARMVGLPYVGTVGACAGKMVALTSPDELPQKYNWATVLRHEFVHVVNLQQTDFHVPHWLTEGIAVHLEAQPRPPAWSSLLSRRLAADALFDLEDITLGFIRPASSDDWTLAYCQSELYVEYMLQTYGEDAITKLLAAYSDRCSTAQALQRCFDVPLADFEAGYLEHLRRVTASEASENAAKPTLAELQRQVEKEPENADAAANLALAWLDRDDKPQARRWAVRARQLQPHHPLASYVLARLQLAIGDTDAALGLLNAAHDPQNPQRELAGLLASLQLKAGDLDAAEATYRLVQARFPGDEIAAKALARIYLQRNDKEKLMPAMRRWSEIDPDNAIVRKKLAQLSLDAKDYESAVSWAKSAVHLDVQDAQAHALLGAALGGQDDPAKAADEYRIAIRLDRGQADWHAALADSLMKNSQPKEAQQALDELRALDPDHPKLEELQRRLTP